MSITKGSGLLTIEDCERNVARLWKTYKSTDESYVLKREEIMKGIDSWLDTMSMLNSLNSEQEGSVPVG